MTQTRYHGVHASYRQTAPAEKPRAQEKAGAGHAARRSEETQPKLLGELGGNCASVLKELEAWRIRNLPDAAELILPNTGKRRVMAGALESLGLSRDKFQITEHDTPEVISQRLLRTQEGDALGLAENLGILLYQLVSVMPLFPEGSEIHAQIGSVVAQANGQSMVLRAIAENARNDPKTNHAIEEGTLVDGKTPVTVVVGQRLVQELTQLTLLFNEAARSKGQAAECAKTPDEN